MMLSPEPLQGLDLMTQKAYHRTNIERELSKNKGVLCRPAPVLTDGFGRTDRTQRLQPTARTPRLLKLNLAFEVTFKQRLRGGG